MTTFYFIDSTIIMGYCNPIDYLHSVALDFFKEKQPNRTFLLYSVNEEFYKKIMNEFTRILKILNPLFRKNVPFLDLQDVINKEVKNPQYETLNFLKYIFHLFQEKKIENLSYATTQEIFNDYNVNLKGQFNNLVRNWIKRPHMTEMTAIFNDKIYTRLFDILQPKVGKFDATHLSLASYEVIMRNRPRMIHDFIFYTDDSDWIKKRLESKINISNLKIKKINYEVRKSMGFNPETNSFNIPTIRRKYLSNGL